MKCQNFGVSGRRFLGVGKRFLNNFRKNFSEKCDKGNKRDFRADGLPLHPSALRPRLLGILVIIGLSSLFTILNTMSTSATSITLSISDDISIDLQPAVGYRESKPATVSISTNKADFGYTFEIKAKNDNDLKNGTHSLTSISQEFSKANFESIAPSNTWGYKPSMKNSAENSNYLPGPTPSPTIIDDTSTNRESSKSYTFSIATKTDTNLASGNYQNTFVLTATANTISYNISYNSNDGSSVQSTVGTTAEKTIKLSSTTPTKNNYDFLGWCNIRTQSESCPGQTYQPGQDFELNENYNATLYAMWKNSGGGCFTAGTLIDTPNGFMPIEAIEKGMKIYAYDFESGEVKEDTVEKTFKLNLDNIVKLTFEDGATIRGTYNHPFYNWSEAAWEPLGSYQYGDIIKTIDGTESKVESVEGIEGNIDTYNLRTQEYFNFIVAVPFHKMNEPSTQLTYKKYLVLAVKPHEDEKRIYPMRVPLPTGSDAS